MYGIMKTVQVKDGANKHTLITTMALRNSLQWNIQILFSMIMDQDTKPNLVLYYYIKIL